MKAKINPVPLVFLVLAAISFYFSEMSAGFVTSELLTRFTRDGLIVLAMVIPIMAGMGLNFAVTVGAINAQIGFMAAIIIGVGGWPGLLVVLGTGIFLSLLTGGFIGSLLNRLQGREMIATIMIGWLYTAVYQMVFMWGYGSWIPAWNLEILLSRGIGVRNMVDLEMFRHVLDQALMFTAAGIDVPLMMIILVLLGCGAVHYFIHTPMGQHMRAVGLDMEKARLNGISVEKCRLQAMIISTIIACIGQVFFLQNFGMLNVYTAHMNSDIFSAAALLAGGATINEARVRNVIFGVLLFHGLFIVAPQAGQNMFGSAVLGEYFRSFAAYGTIALALVINVRQKDNLLT